MEEPKELKEIKAYCLMLIPVGITLFSIAFIIFTLINKISTLFLK